MITLRRNNRRRFIRKGKQDIRRTFLIENQSGQFTDDFGILVAFDEIRLPPSGVSVLCPLEGTEIVTYVFKGALVQEDSTGSSRVIHGGEFQRMTIGVGIRHKETNAIRTDFAHLFRITLRSTEVGLDSAQEQKRFAVGQRHNLLCVIASSDGRNKSLRILQDALVYSSILDSGHHVAHGLSPGRSAWLHVIHGEGILQDIILTEGDGVGVSKETSVSFTAQEKTEILLVDLGPPPRSFA